jgi:hypothetical protein
MALSPGIKRISQVWRMLGSGILVPDGFKSDALRSFSNSYLEMKEKAKRLEIFFAEEEVSIPSGCDLAIYIEAAKKLSDEWLLGGAKSVGNEDLFMAAHLGRIADAAEELRGSPRRAFYLKRLTQGSLDFLKRKNSPAKDLLWELELLNVFRVHRISSFLQEPPDLVLKYADVQIGVACKKVYGEKNVSKTVSNAVGQIESSFQYGIVALNIDDLAPEGDFIRARTQEEISIRLAARNLEFMQRHEGTFLKYMSKDRLMSVLVGCSALVDVFGGETRLNNARQISVWMPESVPDITKAVFNNLYRSVMGENEPAR